MLELDRQLNTENIPVLTPNEVEGSICLSSDGTFSTSTSLGGNEIENYSGLKLLLKDLALKIIKEEYERARKESNNLH